MRFRFIRLGAVLALILPLGACAAAALAGAGAATGIYLTSRGAKAIVEGSVPDVDRRTGVVLAAQGIEVTERKIVDNGERIELKGKTREDQDVSVKLARKTSTTTEVEVEVRKNPVVWDQDRARAILEQIVTTR